jgi:hypothetical protein
MSPLCSGPLQIAFDQVDLPLQSSLSREELQMLAANKRFAGAAVAARPPDNAELIRRLSA